MSNCAGLVDRLRFLAGDMRAVAAEMRSVPQPGPNTLRENADTLTTLAEVAEEWSDEIAAESIP